MKLPIQFALTWPDRAAVARERLDLSRIGTLTFEPPDERRFPCLAHARAAVKAGGAAPIVLNAANEVAVEAFLAGRIPFRAIPAVIGGVLANLRPKAPSTIAATLETDREARVVAAGLTALAAS
jgi:1-deoxy-D-xylulose-5-phosphate reductoisomerase